MWAQTAQFSETVSQNKRKRVGNYLSGRHPRVKSLGSQKICHRYLGIEKIILGSHSAL